MVTIEVLGLGVDGGQEIKSQDPERKAPTVC